MKRAAVVTGGSAGIGLATAQKLAREGWPVAIIARDQARLDEAAALLRKTGVPVLAISADMSDAAAVDAAAARIEAELGPIDAWVNNAMSTVVAPADMISAAEYARVTATTYLSTVHGTLAALRSMKTRRRGVIVQVSSGLAIRAAPLQAAYCGAKFAVSGFTDALRSELIADKVGVALSVVYLPAVNTPQFTWSRTRIGHEHVAPDPLYDPRLCAEAIASTIRTPQREVWVGRTSALMALTQTAAPTLADYKAASMQEAQKGAPMADRRGNLDEPVPGPAAIDGPWTRRTERTRSEFFTSAQRDLAKLGALGVVMLGSVALLPLIVRVGRKSKAVRARRWMG